MKAIWTNVYLRFVLLIAALILIGLLFFTLRQVVLGFVVAYLLAYLLNPIVSWVARRSNRALGVVSILCALLLLIGLLWLLGLRISAQFSIFILKLPGLLEMLAELPFRMGRWLDPTFGPMFQQVYMNIERLSRFLTFQLIPRFISETGRNPANTLLTLAGGGAQIGIVFVLCLYLLYNFPTYTRSFLRAFPHRYRPLVENLVMTAGESVGSYVRGQILIAVGVGLLSFFGLALAGVPLASALGVLAGLFNLVPFLGPILTAAPTLLLALTEGSTQVIFATAILIFVNQFDTHVLTPLVFSRVISLDPVTVIVAVLIGAVLFGFVGALMAVPVAAFLKVMYSTYYLGSRWYKRPS